MGVKDIYRVVYPRMWRSGSFRKLTPMQPSGQGLFLYLLTCPESTSIPGAIVAGRAALAESLGWNLKAFDKAFMEAFAEGMAKADWDARLVWLPGAQKFNKPQSPNVLKNWGGHFVMLPDCDIKVEIYQALKAFAKALGKAFEEAFEEAFSKDYIESGTGTRTRTGTRTDHHTPSDDGRSVTKKAKPDVQWIFDEWNDLAAEIGLPVCQVVSDKRKAAARARLKEYGEDLISQALVKVQQSSFLRGETGNDAWRGCTIDFFLGKKNFPKIIEGNYDDRGPRPSGGKKKPLSDDGKFYEGAMDKGWDK